LTGAGLNLLFMGFFLFAVMAVVSTLVETVKKRKKPQKPTTTLSTDIRKHEVAALSFAGNVKK